MTDAECVWFLQWALPKLGMRWRGFRNVRRQVCRRVGKRVRELGLGSVAEYRGHLEGHAGEWAALDVLCTIPISRFYRDRGVFDRLRDDLLRSLAEAARTRREISLRAWSAGCASGEEPYTLAILWRMVLEPRFPDVRLRIVATDVDERLLDRARRAVYSPGSLRELPAEWRERAFRRDGALWSLRPELREAVELRHQDIRKRMPEETFHLVLCRNLVFTYFDEQLERTIAREIAERLNPGGFLVVGATETVPEDVAGLVPFDMRARAWRRVAGR